jgi:hypothetical protein
VACGSSCADAIVGATARTTASRIACGNLNAIGKV